MTEQIRVFRILEYVGTREFVESSLKNRKVTGEFSTSDGCITEAILGEFPELLQESEVSDKPLNKAI